MKHELTIVSSAGRNLPLPTQHRSVKSIAHKLDTSTKAVLLRYLLVYDIPVVIDNTMAKGAAHLLQVFLYLFIYFLPKLVFNDLPVIELTVVIVVLHIISFSVVAAAFTQLIRTTPV